MIAHETAEWLNRIGLGLGFLSFWFAVPEFIGEPRLRSWERALAATLPVLPAAAKGAFFIGSVLIAGIGSWHSLVTWQLPTMSAVELVGLSTLNAAVFFFESLRGRLNSAAAKLANDEHVRQRSLLFGAALFTVSFALQFIATFAKVAS
jgi:hypothetical protein